MDFLVLVNWNSMLLLLICRIDLVPMAQNGKEPVEEIPPENSAIVMAYSQNVGFAYHLCNLSIAMRKAGWRIVAFGPQMEQIPGLIDKLREEDVGIEIFDASKPYKNLTNELETSSILRRFILKNRPKAILCNGFRQGLTAFLACFGLRGRPRILLTFHSSYYFRSMPGRLMILLSVLLLDRIICLNGTSREYVSHLPLGRLKVEQIPNGLNYPVFDRLSESETLPENVTEQFDKLDPTRPRIVFSAFMLLEKGHDDLLLALKKIKDDGMDPVLIFIGNGPRFEEISAKIKDLGLQDSVLVLGKLDNSVIPKILKGCDIGVSSSYMEQFAYNILEYAAASLPIVATNVGAAGQVVIDGVNGHLVEPGDINGMASSIEELLRDPSKMRSMGRKSREIVEGQFTLDLVARQYLKAFEKS